MNPRALAEERNVVWRYCEEIVYWHFADILKKETVPVEEVRKALEEVFGEEGE